MALNQRFWLHRHNFMQDSIHFCIKYSHFSPLFYPYISNNIHYQPFSQWFSHLEHFNWEIAVFYYFLSFLRCFYHFSNWEWEKRKSYFFCNVNLIEYSDNFLKNLTTFKLFEYSDNSRLLLVTNILFRMYTHFLIVHIFLYYIYYYV